MIDQVNPFARQEIETLIESWRRGLEVAKRDIRAAQDDLERAMGAKSTAEQVIRALKDVLA